MRDRSHPLELLRHAASGRAAAGVRRALVPRGPNLDGRARDGLLGLASNDYLGLCGGERLNAAAAEAARVWDTGSTGSRLVTGTTVLHARLEAALAALSSTPVSRRPARARPWPPSRWSRPSPVSASAPGPPRPGWELPVRHWRVRVPGVGIPRVCAFSQAVQGRHTLMSSEGYGTANFCFPAPMRRRGAHGLRGDRSAPGDRAIAAAP
jgi:hypothetical protein